MNIKDIIKQPEGRRLEFKETLPEHANLAKTIIAFANDAGGELFMESGMIREKLPVYSKTSLCQLKHK